MEEYEWAIIEIMGHRVVAGRVEIVAQDGRTGLLMVEVPDTPHNEPYVKEYGLDAVFCKTPCSKSVARRAAAVIHGPDMCLGQVGAVVPIWDPHCLNDVRDPMQEVDLEAALERDVKREVAQRAGAEVPF